MLATGLDFVFSQQLMHKPTFAALVLRSSVMCCMMACESDNMTMSSAESKSVSLPGDQLIPRPILWVDFLVIHSTCIVMRYIFYVL